jgi:catechol 2,3-dioxygenase-like lactoylglutathione lyase family enzyme
MTTRSGFNQIVFATAQPNQLRDFFIDLGWSEQTRPFSTDALNYWDIPHQTSDLSLLQAPNKDCAVILIPCSNGITPYRPLDSKIIQPGGLFDFNMRTEKAEFAVEYLITHGWEMLVEPVPWQFGTSSVKEMLAIQNDGIVLAAMERVSPPLEGIKFDRFSDIFNATQIVTDIQTSSAFFSALGFNKFVDYQGNMPGEGPRVLGLQDTPAREAEICLTISHPNALMDGSIELISTPNQTVERLPERAFGRGIHRLRIPVDNLEDLIQNLASHYGPDVVVKSAQPRSILGCEELCCAVRTPDGARIDLYQR